jgi:hypothetical protein
MSMLRAVLAVAFVLLLAACSARSELIVRHVHPDVVDVPDACVPFPEGCNPPTVRCSAAASTTAGTSVSIHATDMADAPSRIATEQWVVVSSPPGSHAMLTNPNGTMVDFTGDSAGTYTVQFTATDTAGRSASCTVPITIAPTYRGTDFWAVSTTNSELLGGDVFHFAVAVGNSNDITVMATVTGGVLRAPMTFSVPPHSTVTQNLPWVTALSHNTWTLNPTMNCCDLGCCGSPMGDPTCTTTGGESSVSSLVTNGAYHITTNAPVSMYQFNPLEFSSTALCSFPTNSYTNDASLLLPTPALTGNYLVLSHNAWSAQGSFVAIAGTNANPTTVTVTLAANVTAGPGVTAASAHTTQTYMLGQGDVLQLVSTSGAIDSTTFDPDDMTGTVIQASAPVAVFSGVDCTFMSFGDRGATPACDHIEQMMFPIETWGRDVVVSQLRDRAPNEAYMVRILSGADGNQLTFVPPVHAPVTLARGTFVEFESRADFEVTSTQPMLVGQFMEGQGTTPGATVGDPAFVLEVPTTQFRREYTFVVPDTYTDSFINVVAHTGTGFLLDGHGLGGTFTSVPGTNWSVYRGRIAAGSHRVDATAMAPFGLKVIGVAPYTSYAYPGGLDLQALTR